MPSTQEFIQSLIPTTANNGNPNTAYNQPQSQSNPWFVSPATTAPAVTLPQLQTLGQWNAPQNPASSFAAPKPIWNGWTVPDNGWTPAPPGTPVPPPGGTTTPPVNTGGPNPPAVVNPPRGGGGGGGGELPAGWGGGRGGGGRAGIDLGLFASTPGGGNTVRTDGAYDTAGWGDGATLDSVNEFLGTDLPLGDIGRSLFGTAIGQQLGINQSGGVKLGQIMDYFLPGNVYMGQTGKWNLLNAVPALLSKISPLLGNALRVLMDNLGAKYANIPDDQLSWWKKMLKNRYNKNKENRAAGRRGAGGDGKGRGLEAGTSWYFGGGGTFNFGDKGPDPVYYGNVGTPQPIRPGDPAYAGGGGGGGLGGGFGSIGSFGNNLGSMGGSFGSGGWGGSFGGTSGLGSIGGSLFNGGSFNGGNQVGGAQILNDILANQNTR